MLLDFLFYKIQRNITFLIVHETAMSKAK